MNPLKNPYKFIFDHICDSFVVGSGSIPLYDDEPEETIVDVPNFAEQGEVPDHLSQ